MVTSILQDFSKIQSYEEIDLKNVRQLNSWPSIGVSKISEYSCFKVKDKKKNFQNLVSFNDEYILMCKSEMLSQLI